MRRRPALSVFFLVLLLAAPAGAKPAAPLPHLERSHGTVQLVVDDKPFLVRGARRPHPAPPHCWAAWC